MSTSSSGQSTPSSHPSDNDWDFVIDSLEETLRNVEENLEPPIPETIPPSAHASDDEWDNCSASSETATPACPATFSSSSKPALKTFSSSTTQAEQALGCLRAVLIYHIVNSLPQNSSHEALTRVIHSTLKYTELSPTEIISLVRALPPRKRLYPGLYVYVDEDKRRLNVAAREADYGDEFELECPGGKTLVEDVLALCVDAYMDIDLGDEMVGFASRSGKIAGKAAKTSEESENHSTPEDTPSSPHTSDDKWEAVSTSSRHAAGLRSSTPSEGDENADLEDELAFFWFPKEKAEFLDVIATSISKYSADTTNLAASSFRHDRLSDTIFDALGPLESYEIIDYICGAVLPAPIFDTDRERWLIMRLGIKEAEKEFYEWCNCQDKRPLADAWATCMGQYLLHRPSSWSKDETASKAEVMEEQASKPCEKFDTHSSTTRKKQQALEHILALLIGYARNISIPSHRKLTEAILEALMNNELNATQITDFIRGVPRIGLGNNKPTRDNHKRMLRNISNMTSYGDMFRLGCSCGESFVADVLESCVDDYLFPTTKGNDEISPKLEVTEQQATTPYEKLRTHHTASSSSKKEQQTLQRILMELICHLHICSTSSHGALTKAIYEGLAYEGLNAPQIVDFIHAGPRISILTPREEHKRLLERVSKMANYGDIYHLTCVGGETLVADVLKICLGEYLGRPPTEKKDERAAVAEDKGKPVTKPSEYSMMHGTPFSTLDTCASVLHAELVELAKSAGKPEVSKSLPDEFGAIVQNIISKADLETKKPAAQFKLRPCSVHCVKRCTCYHDNLKRLRVCPVHWQRGCTCCEDERIYKSVVANTPMPSPLSADELKKELLKLVKGNPEAWKELDARFAGGEKSGLTGGYHFAKLESCVPPLQKDNREEKASEKASDKSIMTFAAYVALGTDEEKRTSLTNKQWVKMLNERPQKWKVSERMKESKATNNAPAAISETEIATKANTSLQPSPTKQLERMLSEHVDAPVVFNKILSSSAAPPAGKTDTDQEFSHRQATFSFPSLHLSSTTCSETPTLESDTDSEDLWLSDDEEAYNYLSDSTSSPPQTSKVETLKRPAALAAPRHQGPRAAGFLSCGVDAYGAEIPPDFAIILTILFGVSSFILLLQNEKEVFDSAATVFSYVLPFIGGFWSVVAFVIKAPFLILGWIFASLAVLRGFLAGLGGQVSTVPAPVVLAPVANLIIGLRSPAIPIISTVASTTVATITGFTTPTPSTLVIQDALPSAPPISAIQSLIASWAVKPDRKSTSYTGRSSRLSSDSLTHITSDSWHALDWWSNFMIKDSEYPFTRHNNSLPAADRCEDFVKRFAHYWDEEMGEKKREGGLQRLDLELGNALARVLVDHCTIQSCEENKKQRKKGMCRDI